LAGRPRGHACPGDPPLEAGGRSSVRPAQARVRSLVGIVCAVVGQAVLAVAVLRRQSSPVRRTPGISCERPIRSTLVCFIPLFDGASVQQFSVAIVRQAASSVEPLVGNLVRQWALRVEPVVKRNARATQSRAATPAQVDQGDRSRRSLLRWASKRQRSLARRACLRCRSPGRACRSRSSVGSPATSVEHWG